MPDLQTSLHLDMLNRYRTRNAPLQRMWNSIRSALASKQIYGLHWGDPDAVPPLQFIRDRYVIPYVDPRHTALEIGPGGGRWTRYLLGFGRLYVVDFYPEMLRELGRHFRQKNMIFITNSGTDFPGIEEASIDYLFSFGTFVHLDNHLIQAYLQNMRPLVKEGANIVIQYSDKTKVMAQLIQEFSDNTPDQMRTMVSTAGFRILEEDLTTLWHSSVIRFTI